MKYKSKPHTIRAFQFTLEIRDFPDWFTEAETLGKASVTRNHKSQFITVYGDRDQVEKAYYGDYVCISEHGKIYVLPEAIFNQYYEGVL